MSTYCSVTNLHEGVLDDCDHWIDVADDCFGRDVRLIVRPSSPAYLTPEQARAIGEALILAADCVEDTRRADAEWAKEDA